MEDSAHMNVSLRRSQHDENIIYIIFIIVFVLLSSNEPFDWPIGVLSDFYQRFWSGYCSQMHFTYKEEKKRTVATEEQLHWLQVFATHLRSRSWRAWLPMAAG